MTREECVALAPGNEEMLFVDGHDKAIGMTCEEAYEYFNFNIIGAWMGDWTPCFLSIGDM